MNSQPRSVRPRPPCHQDFQSNFKNTSQRTEIFTCGELRNTYVLKRLLAEKLTGSDGDPIFQNGSGAQFVKTTRKAKMPGVTFHMTMPAVEPIVGGKMVCWASVIVSVACVSPLHFGMNGIRFSRSDYSV